MDSGETPTTTNYQQVTVDVPEDRVAEFHAFFARFLAGRGARGRRPGYGRQHRGVHGRRCSGRRNAQERDVAMDQTGGINEA